ncbi:MAG: hypothetical protein JKY56_14035 [Kofleriaceae bacterium]|nr:hypothetical protein [Kofleriaceae bacterium]
MIARSNAQVFESLRTAILRTLVASRHSIDDSFAALAEETVRRHFDSALRQMQQHLHAPSQKALRHFVSQWSAMLMGLGLVPRSILRAVVTLGDLVVQTSKNTLPPGPGTNLFVREIVRMNFATARELVEVFQQDFVAEEQSHAQY